MIDKIVERVEELLAKEQQLRTDSEEYKKYTDALLHYKEMVKKGLIIPRGNRLMDIEKRSTGNIRFNSVRNSQRA